MSSNFIFDVFLATIRKNFKMEKFENMMKKRNLSKKKKRFHPSKGQLYQCWRAQKIPDVARCFVISKNQNCWFRQMRGGPNTDNVRRLPHLCQIKNKSV